jgi:hypothetical protein
LRHVVAIAIFLLIPCAGAFSEQPPNIGAKFNKSWKKGKQSNLCMTSSAQIDPCVDLVVDGIKYQIAYREETHRVTYVYTSDEKFRTIDGLKVGGSIPVSRETVRGQPGWQSYAATTRDGWCPVVGYDGLQIKLKDGTVLDLTGTEGLKSGIAVILGFSKSHS